MNTYLTCLSAIYPLHFNLFYQKCKTRETILNIQVSRRRISALYKEEFVVFDTFLQLYF